ncbi:MAG: hypothetical protein WC602_00420 [archaeon]
MTGKLPIPNVSINKLTVTVFSAIVLTTLMSCRECPTEPQNEGKDFALDYAGPSFVSLSFSISGSGKRNYAIQRDSLIVLTGTLFGEDTIVTDWNAEPSKTFRYRLLVKDHGETIDKSEWLSVTTMDTTSHDFTWTIDVLGENGTFWDVWAFAENNVWAVGFVYPEWAGSEVHNCYKWDGTQWLPQDIISNYWKVHIYSILAFNEYDIWANSSYPQHSTDSTYYLYHLGDMGLDVGPINDCWGKSSNDMYFVGNGGTIVHYDGQSFTKMANPTDRKLRHVDGCVDSQTGEVRMWAGGWESTGWGSLVKFENSQWSLVWDADHQFYPDQNYLDVGGIYIPNDKYIFVEVGGIENNILVIHSQKYFNDYHILYSKDIAGATLKIRGNAINDFFVVGDHRIIHYNGRTFYFYTDIFENFRLLGVFQISDFVFIVGEEFSSQKAIVIRGERQ